MVSGAWSLKRRFQVDRFACCAVLRPRRGAGDLVQSMRQPTFFAQAWPRFDHQVYWSGSRSAAGTRRRSRARRTPASSQSRSSGRKPEFFWLRAPVPRGRSPCARCSSRRRGSPRGRSSCSFLQVQAELCAGSGTSTPGGAGRGSGGQVERDHRQLAEVGLEEAPFGVELADAEAHDHAASALASAVERRPRRSPSSRRAVKVPSKLLDGEAAAVSRSASCALHFLQADDVGLLRRRASGTGPSLAAERMPLTLRVTTAQGADRWGSSSAAVRRRPLGRRVEEFLDLADLRAAAR